MSFDASAFARDLAALRKELQASIGEADRAHFAKLERWGRIASGLGWATSWMGPNPISAGLIALGTTARWTIVAHHVSHRGLDRVPGGPRSPTFGKGRRRYVDWLDWLHPDAWADEHNVAHHSRTGEVADPDLVEHNMQRIREADWPAAAKWAVVGFYACTWRLTYYAPNAWQVHRRKEEQRRSGDAEQEPLLAAFDPRTEGGRAFLRSIAPYALARFVAAPAAFLPLGPLAAASTLLNALGAEVLTNLYTFVLIAPNHAGDDLHRFDAPIHERNEWHVRQVLGSANFTGGTDVADFLQGFLNYQIEHHLFPELPPLKLREAQPRVEAICAKHGVPYVREPIARRVRKLLAIMVGDASMKRTRDARHLGDAPGAEGDGVEAIAAEE